MKNMQDTNIEETGDMHHNNAINITYSHQCSIISLFGITRCRLSRERIENSLYIPITVDSNFISSLKSLLSTSSKSGSELELTEGLQETSLSLLVTFSLMMSSISLMTSSFSLMTSSLSVLMTSLKKSSLSALRLSLIS